MIEYRNTLTAWYKREKRDLPWRETRDPYKIWVSEIILQQTRVQQGLSYYLKFIGQFPDILSLANANEEEVLKLWQGLGYYSRARNMHAAAKKIVSDFNGSFPSDYTSVRNLKGIGDYTSAAIVSIAFNLPYAVVDGNVYRVLSRLFGISTPIDSTKGKKEFFDLAQLVLDSTNPGQFNQAIMEFGAIQCVPSSPLCENCPLSFKCFAYLNNSISQFPVKMKKAKQRDRYFIFLYIKHKDNFYLEKRVSKDIWRNLFQFPMIETEKLVSTEDLLSSSAWNSIIGKRHYSIDCVSPVNIHLLSHQKLHLRFYSISIEEGLTTDPFFPVDFSEKAKYAVPKPIEIFLSTSR